MTEEQKEYIKTRWEQDATDLEISCEMHFTREYVCQVRNEMGLKTKHRKNIQQLDWENIDPAIQSMKYDCKTIAEMFGCCTYSINKRANLLNVVLPIFYLNKEYHKEFERLYDEGYNDAEIAGFTGKSISAVYHWRKATERKSNYNRHARRRNCVKKPRKNRLYAEGRT